MPLYEFICQNCDSEFEMIVSFSDTDTPACPSCDAENVQRKMGLPAIHFKGSGWYINDSKESKGSKKSKESTGSDSKAEKSSQESKPDKDSTSESKKDNSTAESKSESTTKSSENSGSKEKSKKPKKSTKADS